MKTIIRTLVIAMAVTGAVATTYANTPSAKAEIAVSKTSAAPIPSCMPGDPTGCGIGGGLR